MTDQMVVMVTKKSPDGMNFRICSYPHDYALEVVNPDGDWELQATGLTWEEANAELEMMTNPDVSFEDYNRIMSGEPEDFDLE